jgi:ribonuclease BN (tRNA processing enzyme)
LANGCRVLIHDSQYTDEEYAERVGWGHTSVSHLLAFAAATGVERLVTFHHDPGHDDAALDTIHEDLSERADGFEVVPGKTGLEIEI